MMTGGRNYTRLSIDSQKVSGSVCTPFYVMFVSSALRRWFFSRERGVKISPSHHLLICFHKRNESISYGGREMLGFLSLLQHPLLLFVFHWIVSFETVFSLFCGVRPFGVSLLVAGYDDKGSQLCQWIRLALTSHGKLRPWERMFRMALEKRYTEDMELDDAILDSVKRLELVKTQRPNLESVFFFLRFKMFKTSTIRSHAHKLTGLE
ncbi:uncharacterized protein LOC103832396 isoform X1 [Brassica rapa]|uniref:uncharacterized protein LOC103832396 isoform X1 n=1 Tax=Brassica campestris TaxID=3711 RepID=UPI0004F19266|nr:uncharacterized protein LOC103832396 isoform X1 [Brassica rapa]